MTFRDTSADTTLDNANMSEEFDKWSAENLMYGGDKWAAREGWNARQPEIDALMKMQEEWIKKWFAVVEENESFKAENELMRDALRMALQWIDAVPSETQLPAMPGFDRDYVNDQLTKDFSTT